MLDETMSKNRRTDSKENGNPQTTFVNFSAATLEVDAEENRRFLKCLEHLIEERFDLDSWPPETLSVSDVQMLISTAMDRC